jgi:hypothetical protein
MQQLMQRRGRGSSSKKKSLAATDRDDDRSDTSSSRTAGITKQTDDDRSDTSSSRNTAGITKQASAVIAASKRTSAATAAAAAASQQVHRDDNSSSSSHRQTSSKHRSESDSDDEERISARARRVERLWKELRKPGACPKFEDSAASYVEWCSRFKLCLQTTVDRVNLCSLLAEDAPDDDLEEQRASQVVATLIITSVPIRIAEEITSWEDNKRNSAHSVWEHVRATMLGDERSYIRSLEAEFTALKWQANQTWAAYLTEFDALDRRMCAMGKGRDDDSKRVQVLNAALGRRSASGREIHSLMVMVTQQHSNSTPAVWRREITKIADAFAVDEKTFATASEHKNKTQSHSEDVSSVSTRPGCNGSGQRNNATAGGQTSTDDNCRYFSKHGECRFGDSCRFLHAGRKATDADRPKRGEAEPSSAASGATTKTHQSAAHERKTESCELWRLKGHCQYGERCIYRHDEGVQAVEVEVEASAAQILKRAHCDIIKLDSCCGVSMTPNREWVMKATKLETPLKLIGAFAGSSGVATHKGQGAIPLPDGSTLHIKNLLYVPILRQTLLSVGELEEEEGWKVRDDRYIRMNANGEITCAVAIETVNNTWRLTKMLQPPRVLAAPVTTRSSSSPHVALGHG